MIWWQALNDLAWFQALLLLGGLALIVFGADWLVDGASGVARRFGLSEFVIGLTIVGMGTSAPEMVVSFIGAFQGNADIAIGNVVGSNIMNTLLILGLTAIILPMAVTPSNRKRDIPMNLGITVLLIILGLKYTIFRLDSNGLSRWDGGILLAVFILYMWSCFKTVQAEEDDDSPAKKRSVGLCLLLIAAGLAGLIIGGNLFVNNATKLAHEMGVSDKFIAITILAGGTSMPELATCVVAAAKKKGQLALGNIIGSNVFNILLILGGSALIHPLSFEHITLVDLGALLVSALALVSALFIGKKNKIDRLDGSLFLLVWAAYMAFLISKL
jgi:cation:H+ antiporter